MRGLAGGAKSVQVGRGFIITQRFCPGVYKVPYSPLFKSVGEEYQVVKRGREFHGCGEEYNVTRGKGEGDGNFEEES